MSRARHSPATARIQRRLEQLELDHLRQHAAEQAQRIEDLEAQVEQLTREVHWADGRADMWQDAHERLAEHLDEDTADARCIGLTQQGDLLVIRAGASQ
jgi:chromosome segregation ATPase